MFIHTAITVFNAIFQLALISLAAGVLVRKGVVSSAQVQALSSITINIFLPCMIFATILMRFVPGEFENWWLLPLCGFFTVIIGLVISGVLFRFRSEKRPLMTLASMQNAIYIVLPIGQILFSHEFDTFALYAFLFMLGLNPVMWSIGKVMISADKDRKIQPRDFITPPLTAIFFSVAAVFTGLVHYFPQALVASIDMMGQATVPSAVFVLGATIGTISLTKRPDIKDVMLVGLCKFILVPAVVFAFLFVTRIHSSMPLLGTMLMIQAASPPATNLILMVKSYGGDSQTISSIMLILYIVSILALPFWIALYQYSGI